MSAPRSVEHGGEFGSRTRDRTQPSCSRRALLAGAGAVLAGGAAAGYATAEEAGPVWSGAYWAVRVWRHARPSSRLELRGHVPRPSPFPPTLYVASSRRSRASGATLPLVSTAPRASPHE